jgi:uncharacterized protein (DUF427 family)
MHPIWVVMDDMMRRRTGHHDADPGAGERRSGVAPNAKPYESVWDFPRPPALESVPWRIRVIHNGIDIVDAPEAIRVLETSQPPAYYVDPRYVSMECVRESSRRSMCEWKGPAVYATIDADGAIATDACWSYPKPTARFAAITGFWAFYAQALDECYVDDELVVPNPGSFYGGWMTAQVTGPVKGAPGTLHW